MHDEWFTLSPTKSLASAYMLWGKDEPGSATFVIRVKNNGKKVIKGISWEHALSFSSGNNKVNLRLDLNSGDMYLRPGEEQLVLSVINKIFDSAVARFTPERIRLTKVEYEDGLSWQRADDGAK